MSCIFQKGKQLYWKNVENNAWFLDLFSTIGTNCSLTSDQLQGFEYFTCTTSGKGPGGLNLDQMGMCHWRFKFITLFWSGKTQKVYPVLELPLLP